MHYWELREEAIKSWEHFETDEIVYLRDAFGDFGDSRLIPTEIYSEGSGWIELEFFLHGDREAYYMAIISCLKDDSSTRNILFRDSGEPSIQEATVCGNSPMLIEVTQLVKPPQRVTFKGIPSVIRLKRFNLAERFVGNSGDLSFKTLEAIPCEHFNSGPLDSIRNSVQSRQTPYGLIESRSHVVNSIGSDQANFARNWREFKPKDVAAILYILLSPSGIGFRGRGERGGSAKVNEFGLECFKMSLRPTNLQIRVCH